MSIPPQLIRVKRKRVEETPVTFLQFDEGIKRHRSGSHWAYQRRDARTLASSAATSARDIAPVIHVSTPVDNSVALKKQDGAHITTTCKASPRPIARAKSPAPDRRQAQAQSVDGTPAEPRRFHISRTMMTPSSSQSAIAGVSKRGRSGPAVFVERTRKKMARMAQHMTPSLDQVGGRDTSDEAASTPPEMRPLKKPGATTRKGANKKVLPSTAPLPPSLMNRHNEDMDKIAADMNDWVMAELGTTLETIELEKKQERQQADRAKLRPKPPAKRYQERQPEPALAPPGVDDADGTATEPSEDEENEGDWVIDEYVRIPANSMALDVAPAEVGLLVLDNEEESMLFFGPEHDDDDELGQDDEDENAENYYTADYPDEVDSEDENDQHVYGYRNRNMSDDEEFDNDTYEDEDSDEMVIERGADDDDATMARIRAYNMKQNAAFR